MTTFSELFEYSDGKLLWKIRPANRVKIGDEAGSCHDGYVRIHSKKLDGKPFAHNIIWSMFNGDIPDGFYVDHINGVRSDNRIENLRLVTKSQNGFNRKLNSNSVSGIKNVSWKKTHNSWGVSIAINNVRKTIGYFKDLELADLVAQEARFKFHGEYAKNY